MPSKYGNMPVNPSLLAKVRGDAGEYRVHGVDWFNHRVLLDRTISNEWVDIAKVAIHADTLESDCPRKKMRRHFYAGVQRHRVIGSNGREFDRTSFNAWRANTLIGNTIGRIYIALARARHYRQEARRNGLR